MLEQRAASRPRGTRSVRDERSMKVVEATIALAAMAAAVLLAFAR
jgi:hypothetical protein